jgi:mRNA-degrading endonuclease toxin of MazEF toxin-antitoxin module
MANRGDVLQLKNRLGFLPKGEAGSVVVVQASALNTVLPTLLVAPMDHALSVYANDPTAVPVLPREAGTKTDQVALVAQIRPVRLDLLAPGAVGRLGPQTQARLDRALRLVLGL